MTTVGWCSYCSREREPAEPRSMYSRSRSQRERDRRRPILQAKAQSNVLKRLLWHRPRDVVAGATGHGDVDETIVELEASSASAALSCYTGSELSDTVKLKGNTFDAALSVEVLYTTPHIYEQMTAQIMATSLTCLSTTR